MLVMPSLPQGCSIWLETEIPVKKLGKRSRDSELNEQRLAISWLEVAVLS